MLKKLTEKVIVLITVTIAFTSCGKKGSPSPNQIQNKKATVYISGNHISKYGVSVAAYWKNGVEVLLGDTLHFSQANAITVNDTDVYIAGSVNFVATYWKNGNPVSLPGIGGSATGITIVGKDVYVTGSGDIGGVAQAVYWKNGVAVGLSDSKNTYFANSIAVVGSDVYIAGNKVDTIMFWKNGAPTSIANSPSTSAIFNNQVNYQGWTNIAVNNGDVYITGATPTHLAAAYWKNGVINKQVNDPTLTSVLTNIAIYGTDIYTTGFYSLSAAYWKNGTLNRLSGGSQPSYMATAIAVNGSDVYVSGIGGYPDTYPFYWKNGTLIQLPDGKGVTTGVAITLQ